MPDSPPVCTQELVFPQGAMCYDSTRVASPSPALFDPTQPQLHAVAVAQGGRQAAWFVQGEFGHGVLRHYRRGGAIARISTDRYLWHGAQATRSMAEFRILALMHGAGLAVPRPIAAAYWRSGFTYRAAILVERIEQARTLTEVVHGTNTSPADSTSYEIARAVFTMHEAGFWHADLNAYNILLDHQGNVYLIDFDKAVQGRVSPAKRFNNLRRLRRSLRKVAANHGEAWWNDINRAYRNVQTNLKSTGV